MIPEFPTFKGLEIADKEEIEKITSQHDPYSDFNFTSMWSWDIKGEMKISRLNDNLIVKFTDYISGEPFYSILGINEVDRTIKFILEFSRKDLNQGSLRLVPHITVERADTNLFLLNEDRDNFDYLYDLKLLATYHGRLMDTKRNLVNRLLKYRPGINSELIDISDPNIQREILLLVDLWEKNKIDSRKAAEKKNEVAALKRLFTAGNSLSLVNIGIYDGDTLTAFSISEILKEPYVITHFAKSDATFPGIYTFLMRETCKYMLCYDRSILNYEQDLGLPNLRFSKKSFRPVEFLKKYEIHPKV